MNRIIFCFIVVTSLVVASFADIVGDVGRVERLLPNAKVILKAKVVDIDGQFNKQVFSFQTLSILKNNSIEIPPKFQLHQNNMALPFYHLRGKWQEEQFAKDQVYLLFYSENWQGKLSLTDGRSVIGILPASDKTIENSQEILLSYKIFKEISKVLPAAKSEIEEAGMLILLSYFADKSNMDLFQRYLQAESELLNNAANSALLFISPSEENIQEAIDDFHKDSNIFWTIYEDVQVASRCGDWGFEEPLTSRAKLYLPIYRTIIDETSNDYSYVHIAIEALTHVGTQEDIGRLYKFIDDKTDWKRHDVLEGITRILDMDIQRPAVSAYGGTLPQYMIEWEKQTREVVDKKLREDGLLK